VRAVRDDMAGAGHSLAYTTVMTLLDRLARRDAVSRTKKGRSFLYVPKLNREQALAHALEELAATFFGGSQVELRSYVAGNGAAGTAVAGAIEEDLDITLL